MNIVTEPSAIRNVVTKLRPEKVAVAFVGRDWKEYVDPSTLAEIILWPTFPSNPVAIEQLFETIGIENVHFLDGLHSKMYISKRGAVLGSFNLSRNGFGDGGHFEAGVIVDKPATLKKVANCYESYRRKAKKLYPSESSKRSKLRELKDQWISAHLDGWASNEEVPERLGDYKVGAHRIHIAWWGPDNTEFNERNVVHQLSSDNPKTIGRGTDLDKYFRDTMRFLPSDDVRVGDWILMWRCNEKSGMPRRNGPIDWLYVHHVIPNGVDFANEEPDDYTTLVGESARLGKPPAPFVLTNEVKDAVRAALCSGDFPELIDENNDQSWELRPADLVGPRFLKRVQELVRARPE